MNLLSDACIAGQRTPWMRCSPPYTHICMEVRLWGVYIFRSGLPLMLEMHANADTQRL